MRANLTVFRLQKGGNKPDEYEDAHASALDEGCFAVADGATESAFAKLWAEALVDGFVRSDREQRLSWSWVPNQQKVWNTQATEKPIPWHAEEKFHKGAFATFLGLVLDQPMPGNDFGLWDALAVGDSCLFHLRDNKLLQAFPLQHSAEFNLRPKLIGSRFSLKIVEERTVLEQGQWQLGDRFWLMTDALAQWFLAQGEAGIEPDPIRTLLDLIQQPESQDAFEQEITALRTKSGLRNDDVTMLAVEIL